MKRIIGFIKREWLFLSLLAVFYTTYYTLSGEPKEILELVVGLMSPIGYILIGWYIRKWWLNRQNMTLTYIKSSDAGMLYVKNVKKQKEKLYIRSEPVADGITFNYDRETGELWSIHVFGTNNDKNEGTEK